MDPLDSLLVRIDALVTTLIMGSAAVQKNTIHTLRLLSKQDDDHRSCIGDSGGIPHLLRFISSPDPDVQEDAITCLLNASIVASNKERIMSTRGAVERIIQVLRTGTKAESRQNAAATLFSILVVEEYRDALGQKEGVIPSLLQLLQEEDEQSIKDALRALFHLSLEPRNKSRMIRQGTVPLLVHIINNRGRKRTSDDSRSASNLAADALSLMTQLAACPEGVSAVKEHLSLLVQVLEPGELSRCREQAAAALLMLCQTGGESIVGELVNFEVCVSALCSLLSSGSQRARSKAGALLQILMVNERS